MKEKFIIFISGLLLGAIISTTSIYVYKTAINSNNNQFDMQIPNNIKNKNNPVENPNNKQNNSQTIKDS